MRYRVICLSSAMILLALIQAGLAIPTEPGRSWVYSYLDELRLSCDSLSFFVTSLPAERVELGETLKRCRIAEGPGEERMAYLVSLLRREFGAEARWREYGTNLFVGELTASVDARSKHKIGSDNMAKFNFYFNEGFALWTYLRLTVTDPEAHRMETRAWGDYFRASFDHGGIGYRRGRFSLFTGRDEAAWGLNRDSGLIFSGSAPVMDMFRFTYVEDKVKFTSIHSRLRRGEDDPWDESTRRYVSAHRLDLKLWPSFTFSLSEAVLYGGQYRNFDPFYINPIGLFYAEQWNSRSEDNVIFAGDFSLLLSRKAEIRGEIVIDDFQYDFSNPHEIGFGLDLTARNPLFDLYSLLGCSYFHIRNGTYGHKVEYNRYTHENKIIGYPFGPDGDYLEFRFSFSLPTEALWTVWLGRRRQGEGRVSDPQDDPPEDVKFPSGTVEKTLRTGLDFSWRPSYYYMIAAGIEYNSVRNGGNVYGADRSDVRLELEVAFNIKTDYVRQ